MSVPHPHVTIHTDGCCLGNPGPGGYAAVLQHGATRSELSGGYRQTTNNRMELMAAIAALQALKRPCEVQLVSDSDYVIHGGRKLPSRKGFKLNRDLWDRFESVWGKHKVTFKWVPGHSGIAGNERCDELAKLAARGSDLKVDGGYEREHPLPEALHLAESSVSKGDDCPRIADFTLSA